MDKKIGECRPYFLRKGGLHPSKKHAIMRCMAKKKKPSIIPEGVGEVALFKNKKIRKVLHNNEWWFSITDILEGITGTERPRQYWTDLKKKLRDEGYTELYDFIVQLKMKSPDGKMRETDSANTETLFRIIQSVPSPRAQPFKRWLARVGYERIEEFQNPEIGMKRAVATYKVKGYSDDWITARIRTMSSRKNLTDEWQKRGVQIGKEYAILTDEISSKTFDLTTKGHKQLKKLSSRHNLRDNMTDMELVLTMLGETSTAQFAKKLNAQGFFQNKQTATRGGKIAGAARRNVERQLGEKVVSSKNYLPEKKTPQLKQPRGRKPKKSL